MTSFLLLSALSAVASTQAWAQEPYTFAGLSWGSTPQAAGETLSVKGYQLLPEEDDGHLAFTGTIALTPADIYALFDGNGRLVRVVVFLKTEDANVRRVYESTVEQLRAKYGKPDLVNHFFEPPYSEGDGYENQAIRLGKGHFGVSWRHGMPVDRSGTDALVIGIAEDLKVTISYESVAWQKEADRRNAEAAKDL